MNPFLWFLFMFPRTSAWHASLLPKGCRKPSSLISIEHLTNICLAHDENDRDNYNGVTTLNADVQARRNHQALWDTLQDLQTLPTDAERIFHGRGGLYAGCEHLTVDWLAPVWLVVSFVELSMEELEEIGDHLLQVHRRLALANAAASEADSSVPIQPPLNWVYQCRSSSSSGNRAPSSVTVLMAGNVPNPHIVTEFGSKYYIRLLNGQQNHGLFLDMAYGRRWLQKHAGGQVVLNLFAYTCGFSIAAIQGGAVEVVNVDMANGPLKVGQRNHELNEIERGRARFLAHDIFKSWGKIKKLGPYGIIVVDPPSFQRNSFVAKSDYAKVIRRLPGLLRQQSPDDKETDVSLVLLCLNAPELNTTFLQSLVHQAAPELEFVERIDNPPKFAAADPERALKVLVYKLNRA